MHNFYYDFYSHYTCFLLLFLCFRHLFSDYNSLNKVCVLWLRFICTWQVFFENDYYTKDMFSLITISMHTACVPWQLVPMFVTCVSKIYIDVHGMRSLISIYIYTCLFWFRSLCAKYVFFNNDIFDKRNAVFDFDFYAICMCFWLLFLCTRHVFFYYDLYVDGSIYWITVSLLSTCVLWLRFKCTKHIFLYYGFFEHNIYSLITNFMYYYVSMFIMVSLYMSCVLW